MLNKAERLHDLMIYLNDKKSFHLKTIMDRYTISKSTALRDIQSLEKLGMPLYSTMGRNGSYKILPNRLLSPIIFTINEVYALYFAMRTLKAYQSTPFHLNIEQLKHKFERCISEEQIKKLRTMELVFSLGSYESRKECPCLEDILHMAVEERVCTIRYAKGSGMKRYTVQFYTITSAYGQWYATAMNIQTRKPQVFRCDKIHSVKVSDAHPAQPLAELLIPSHESFREEGSTDFVVRVTAKGADLFDKEHYPSMERYDDNGECCIKGYYNKGEESFIANFFIPYGEHLLAIQPAALKQLVLERLDTIKAHVAALARDEH